MHRIAIVVWSSLDGAGHSAVYRALMFADELRRAGDAVAIVFDGAGSTALAAMLDPAHDLHRVWGRVAPALRGVCRHCAKACGALDALQAAGVPLLADDRGHASLRALLGEGLQIVTV